MPGMNSIKWFIQKNHRAIFYGGWLLINLLQAGMTELFDDEAYYWVYSHYLDWGYFDHPPMIALLIKAGYFLVRNELGVRLLTVILSTGTLLVIERLLPKKNDLLFYAIACSMAVLQIGGIMAVPDIPLLFFSALFFLQYRRFLHRMNSANATLLGLLMALMLYSKYHAVLVICFTFLPPTCTGNTGIFFPAFSFTSSNATLTGMMSSTPSSIFPNRFYLPDPSVAFCFSGVHFGTVQKIILKRHCALP